MVAWPQALGCGKRNCSPPGRQEAERERRLEQVESSKSHPHDLLSPARLHSSSFHPFPKQHQLGTKSSTNEPVCVGAGGIS
jgi:hypothetical protein